MGYRFREVGRTPNVVVFEKRAHRTTPVFFGAVAIIPAAVTFQTDRFLGNIVGLLLFGAFAAYSAIHSTYTADRQSGQLLVERKILFWKLYQVYPSHVIERIERIDTAKGTGLRIRFRSGRKKTLTNSISFNFEAHTYAASIMNEFLYTSHSISSS
jgi:hypothetical protein